MYLMNFLTDDQGKVRWCSWTYIVCRSWCTERYLIKSVRILSAEFLKWGVNNYPGYGNCGPYRCVCEISTGAGVTAKSKCKVLCIIWQEETTVNKEFLGDGPGQVGISSFIAGHGPEICKCSELKNHFHTNPNSSVLRALPNPVGISLRLGGVINSTYPWLHNRSLDHVIWTTGYEDIVNLKQQYHGKDFWAFELVTRILVKSSNISNCLLLQTKINI